VLVTLTLISSREKLLSFALDAFFLYSINVLFIYKYEEVFASFYFFLALVSLGFKA